MKKTILASLLLGSVGLTGFIEKSVNYEQIAFDYFFSEIFENDFKGLSAVEFKGKTEDTYSTLGQHEFCLEPEERLQPLMRSITSGSSTVLKKIEHEHIKNASIVDFRNDSSSAKLYLYHTLRVAGNFYVFLLLETPGKPSSRYVFELTPEGEVSRSCKMG